MKRCSKCGVEKPLERFGNDKRHSSGKKSQCKDCLNQWTKDNKHRWYDPAKSRAKYLRQTYGITVDQYESILLSQEGVCAICKRPSEKTLHVDHNHSCCPGFRSCGSCIRGLLCYSCNSAMGLLADDANTLRAAIAYLELWC